MKRPGWYHESFEHSLAARGVRVRQKFNPDKFVQREVRGFFKITNGRSVFIPKSIDGRFKQAKQPNNRFAIAVERRGPTKPKKGISKRKVVAFEMQAPPEEVAKRAKKLAEEDPDQIVFVGRYVGELDRDPIFQDEFSLRVRKSERKVEVESSPGTMKARMDELISKAGTSLEDNTDERRFEITIFRQRHLINRNKNIQKNLFYLGKRPFILRDADDIWINREAFNKADPDHRKLLAMVRGRIK